MPHPVIDYKKCKGTAACLENCPVGVFEKAGKKVVVKNPDSCIDCKACEGACPNDAVHVVE